MFLKSCYFLEQSSKVPEWNFYKYLVGPDGQVINAWGTRTELEEIFPEVQSAVEEAKSAAKESLAKESDETKSEEPEETVKEEL